MYTRNFNTCNIISLFISELKSFDKIVSRYYIRLLASRVGKLHCHMDIILSWPALFPFRASIIAGCK